MAYRARAGPLSADFMYGSRGWDRGAIGNWIDHTENAHGGYNLNNPGVASYVTGGRARGGDRRGGSSYAGSMYTNYSNSGYGGSGYGGSSYYGDSRSGTAPAGRNLFRERFGGYY